MILGSLRGDALSALLRCRAVNVKNYNEGKCGNSQPEL
ncbi:hypothetical protein D8I24_3528 [Cupriavidus necator H850]|nr:hypothetical protein D8I24_3528 [Cupriavidus necator H850]